jgi:hypothetical protein
VILDKFTISRHHLLSATHTISETGPNQGHCREFNVMVLVIRNPFTAAPLLSEMRTLFTSNSIHDSSYLSHRHLARRWWLASLDAAARDVRGVMTSICRMVRVRWGHGRIRSEGPRQ